MKQLDTKAMDKKQLTEFVSKTRAELAVLKRALHLGQETNSAKTRKLRRDIARALTASRAAGEEK